MKKRMYYCDTCALTGAAIDSFSELIGKTLEQYGIERQNILRIRLSMEEAMLRMRSRYGEEQQLMLSIRKRRRHLIIQTETEGDAYNPLSSSENDLEALGGSLLAPAGLTPQYSYFGRKNTLRVKISLPSVSPVVKILLAVATGVLIGCLGNLLISVSVQNTIIRDFMQPLYDLWMRILNTMSGLVIFFMVINTVLDTDSISRKGGSGLAIVFRYFILSFLFALIAVYISGSFFRASLAPDTGIQGMGIRGLMNRILSFVPKNIIDPFSSSNTPQLLCVAIVLGSALNAIGIRADHLKNVIRQINMVGLQITEWVSTLVPFFLGILLGMEIWQRKTYILTGVWKCILLSLTVSVFGFFIVLTYVASKKGISLPVLVRKVREPFMLALKYGSLEAVYGQTESCCIKKLGIKKEFTEMSLSGGLVLYMPVSVIGTMIFIVYAAVKSDIRISLVWCAMAIVLSVVVFVATPPVPGANLLAYVVTFSQLGIPQSVLIDAMLFDIVFGVFAGAGNQLLLQLDMILQADRLGMLNEKRLQKSQ